VQNVIATCSRSHSGVVECNILLMVPTVLPALAVGQGHVIRRYSQSTGPQAHTARRHNLDSLADRLATL
jgi:hypothetical protein